MPALYSAIHFLVSWMIEKTRSTPRVPFGAIKGRQLFFGYSFCTWCACTSPGHFWELGVYGVCQSSTFSRLDLAPSNNCPLHFHVKYHFRVLNKHSFSIAHLSTLLNNAQGKLRRLLLSGKRNEGVYCADLIYLLMLKSVPKGCKWRDKENAFYLQKWLQLLQKT